MSLMTLKKMRFANEWKKGKKNVERLLKKISYWKKKKKQEEFKENEGTYWKGLGELNKQFKANKKVKKEAKKCPKEL